MNFTSNNINLFETEKPSLISNLKRGWEKFMGKFNKTSDGIKKSVKDILPSGDSLDGNPAAFKERQIKLGIEICRMFKKSPDSIINIEGSEMLGILILGDSGLVTISNPSKGANSSIEDGTGVLSYDLQLTLAGKELLRGDNISYENTRAKLEQTYP